MQFEQTNKSQFLLCEAQNVFYLLQETPRKSYFSRPTQSIFSSKVVSLEKTTKLWGGQISVKNIFGVSSLLNFLLNKYCVATIMQLCKEGITKFKKISNNSIFFLSSLLLKTVKMFNSCLIQPKRIVF